MNKQYRFTHCKKLFDKGLTKEEILPLLKTFSSRNKNYWIERGYDEEEAKTMAMSRCPGTIEYYKIYKNLPEDKSIILSKEYQEKRALTKKNLIKKYGKELGVKKWNSYREKQRVSNTFEYKQKKYGWDRSKFENYNKSRSVTKENLIKRHGEEKGIKKWNDYVDKQSYTKSKEYVIEKYGEDVWKRINLQKSHTYESYLTRNGGNVEKATKEYTNYIKNSSKNIGNSFSKIADEMFTNIIVKLIEMGYKKIFCHSYNQEWFLINKDKSYIFLDFYLRDTGKVIEFYGDYWHANPKKYEKNDVVNLRSGGIMKCEEVWSRDKKRIDTISKVPYINGVKIVWENDYRSDKDVVIEECIEFLTKK